MSGVVVWFTGPPASGKTTLARRVRDRLAEAGVHSQLLDSDEVREALALYAAAREGRAPDLPGAGAAYERPTSADVVARGGHDDDDVAAVVRAAVPPAR